MIAVGLGLRSTATSDAIVALVRATMAGRDAAPSIVLATLDTKAAQPALAAAAQRLGYPLTLLSRAALAAQATGAATRSQRVLALHGVPSVAETAALAAAGEGAVLVVRRVTRDGVACAVAEARAATGRS